MKDFALINGKVVTEKAVFAATVFVHNGKIKTVKKGVLSAAARAKIKVPLIDIKGMHILPGLIDAHVHFRTPGMTAKEDWVSGSKAALAGGVTTVLDMPNTVPPTVDFRSLREKRVLVAKKALVNYGFYLGATLDNLKELVKVKNIAGVKIYMGSSTGNLLVKDKEILEKFFAEAARGGKSGRKLLAIHAENEDCILAGAEKYANKVDAAQTDAAVHSLIRAPQCAYEAVKEIMHLAKKYGTRVHVCHCSTLAELDTVKKFKGAGGVRGQQLSVEVTPHHLFLTEKDYPMYGNLIKVNPPIRGLIDQVALWDGIRKGLVDMIATDHAPHLLAEKMQPYAKAPSGIPGVQTMLPLLLNAVNDGKLSLQKVVALTSANPARLFGIKGKGQIKSGFDADFAIVNLNLPEKVCHHYLWSKANWSPFHGWVLKGWPIMTFVNGELMYEWRNRFGKSLGKEVKFA